MEEGRRLITSSAPFDLVIADLMFPREDFPGQLEPRGLDLVREASRRSSHTFILAISIGPEHVHDLMERARQLGAHHVVRRIEFSTESSVHSPAAIAAQIQAHLLDNGTVSTCEVRADPRDPGIQGLLHQVGEATVARLYAKILESGGHQAERIDLRFLTPGASGASVCAVTAYLPGGPPDESHPETEPSQRPAGARSRTRKARRGGVPAQPAHPAPTRAYGRASQRLVRPGWPVHRTGHHLAELAAVGPARRTPPSAI